MLRYALGPFNLLHADFPFRFHTFFIFFSQGFKFALAMEQQAIALKEANLALQATLEEARDDLARAEESVSSIV